MIARIISISLLAGLTLTFWAALLSGAPIDRPWEPVVVNCCYLPELSSVDVDYIRVIAFDGEEWQVIPFQVDEGKWAHDDELDMDFYYYDPDDENPGNIDNTDEICFMIQDVGEKVTHDNWMTGCGNVRYEVGVYDGTDNSYMGWAYIVAAPGLPLNPTDYIDIPETGVYESDIYTIGFRANADHIMEDLTIKPPYGDGVTDFYDRSKTRVKYRILFITLWSTENDLNIIGESRILKDGPVRCLAEFEGRSGDFEKSLRSSSAYYQKFIDTDNTISTMSALVTEFLEIRYSRDLNEEVEDLTVYTDFGHECQEFVVDGVDDPDDDQPVGSWLQVDHPTAGSNVLVQDLWEVEQIAETHLFYQDGGTDPSGVNTGSDGLWGEHGFIGYNPPKTKLTINSMTYMLPANQGCVGPVYEEYYYNPNQYSGACQMKNPICTVTATPDFPHIVIPKAGGIVSFEAKVKNQTPDQQTIKAWVDVTIPPGYLPGNACVYNAVFGPLTVKLPGNAQGKKNLDVAIPGFAPAGMYTMNCKIGYTENDIIWSDSFPFRKAE